jgi:Tfp pilus assembly protein PilF
MFLPSSHAADNFHFQPNPPSKRYDFYSNAPEARHQLKVVEKYHWDRAMKHLKGGNYRQAHKNLDHILRYVPNHPHALERYSKLAVKRGKPKSALPYLDFAVKFRPNSISTYIVYGIHRFRLGQFAKAAKRFRQALERDPDHAEAHYNLGLALLEQGKFAKARGHAQKAYALGYPLPGLKNRLEKNGHWN